MSISRGHCDYQGSENILGRIVEQLHGGYAPRGHQWHWVMFPVHCAPVTHWENSILECQ